EGSAAPTGGIASVTRKILPRGLAFNAMRKLAASTWWPSTITPHHEFASSNAAPTTPGARLVSGDIALKRWVNPRTPASSAVRTVEEAALEWPAATITPAATRFRITSG